MILRLFFLVFLSTIGINAFAQCDRWQHEVDYKMEIDFDDRSHNYFGKQVVKFRNNSSDTLSVLYFHLYLNAFQPGSSMDIRSMTIVDPDSRVGDRINKLRPDEIGFQRIQRIRQGDKDLRYEIYETILKVYLESPSLPGKEVEVFLDYDAQVPLQIRRNGRMNREGIHYSMAQWYPKVCHHDEMGWHTNQYIGREFYGIFGTFDVKISINSAYTIGGTGYLENSEEIGKGYSDASVSNTANKLTWHFKADGVHDFMWAADPEYAHDQIVTSDDITLRFFYRRNEKTQDSWSMLPTIMVEAFDFIQKRFGKYPYKQYSFVQGGDGGMEYPMATLITGHRSLSSLVGVSVHELMHSWYHGVLGINESLFPWMDEGFTSYASELVMDHLAQKGLLPGTEPKAQLFRGASTGYMNMVAAEIQEPLTTHADHYVRNTTYGISSYSKGALYLHQLSYIIGNEALLNTLLAFYDRCAFKHPDGNDIRRVAEMESGLELKWYNEYWINSTKTIDYGIDTIISVNSDKSRMVIGRYGDMPMPVDVHVRLNNGATTIYHIPLDLMFGAKPDEGLADNYKVAASWKWVSPKYLLDIDYPLDLIKEIIIDPSNRMQDIERGNNQWGR